MPGGQTGLTPGQLEGVEILDAKLGCLPAEQEVATRLLSLTEHPLGYFSLSQSPPPDVDIRHGSVHGEPLGVGLGVHQQDVLLRVLMISISLLSLEDQVTVDINGGESWSLSDADTAPDPGRPERQEIPVGSHKRKPEHFPSDPLLVIVSHHVFKVQSTALGKHSTT